MVDRCLICARFRGSARKHWSPGSDPQAECWQEVMVDLEGPYNPSDKDGNHYTMTYICCLCHGIYTERSKKCNAAEARRMFATCMLRSGCLPTIVRSDRGPEFKNALMKEYMS